MYNIEKIIMNKGHQSQTPTLSKETLTNEPVLKDFNARILYFLQNAQYAEAEKLSDWLISDAIKPIFEATFYLGVALQFQGKIERALATFNKALKLSPQHIDLIQAIASCLDQLKRFDESEAQLLVAHKIAPEDAGILANLGSISEKLQKADKALSYYDQALAINPKTYVAMLNRGALLANMGMQLQALAHCRIAHQIHPESIGTLYNLVDALLGVFKYQEALAYADNGLSWQPNHANLLFKKGLILCCLEAFDEAHACLAKAQVLDPKVLANCLPVAAQLGPFVEANLSPEALYLDAMYQAQIKCFWRDRGSYTQAIEQFSQTGLSKNMNFNHEFGFAILSLAINAEARLRITQSISELTNDMAWLFGAPPFSYKRQNREHLRIGYVSSDFRRHPTGLLSRQIYAMHNKQSMEVYIYSLHNDAIKEDVRLSVERDCKVFHDVATMTDVQIATLIHQDEIDILVDLNGYTAKARTMLFSLRPAPIQVSYLAYLQSMGADFIDYTMLDELVCPKGYDKYWQEKIVRLPDSLYVYDTETPNSTIEKTRSDFGLPEKAFVFCCLSACYKIEPEIFTVWMSILNKVPNSVLWLLSMDELTRDNLQAQALLNGVDKTRLIFAQSLPHKEHLLRYQLADLFIDTYWCGAHTTALDALWQGLPILCCIGKVSSSRVAASFLTVLEMPELITQNFDEYEQKAVEYATNPLLIEALKQKLKEKKVATPLFNTALTVKYIESAYQAMWQRYISGLPPENIDVANLSVE